jgi:2-keto-3-deoxy-L-rhamnonate aldolase RhmA
VNAAKDLLKSGQSVIGVTGSPTGEIAVLADSFDFILFDTQHSPVEVKQLIPTIAAMKGKKAAPIIRVSDNRADLICFALDAGARGIIVPMINSRAEAEAVVRACRYAPLGDRSNSGVRGEWGDQPTYRDYLDTVNRDVLIIPMIETQRAIHAIDDILSVEGIDVLLVGPSDLSIELGVPLEYPSDTYQAGLDKIAAACKRHNVVPGMYFIPPGMDPNFYVAKGFKFFTVPWAPMAAKGIQAGIAEINR